MPAIAQDAPSSEGAALIVYFSFSGTTETVARIAHRETGLPWAALERPHALMLGLDDEDEGPEPLDIEEVDIAQYERIVLGFPIWSSQMPEAVETWLKSTDLRGKTILPFCTHGGDGPGTAFADLMASCPDSHIKPQLVLLGGIQEDGVLLPLEDEQLADIATRLHDWLNSSGIPTDWCKE